jgi:hypothetical protein
MSTFERFKYKVRLFLALHFKLETHNRPVEHPKIHPKVQVNAYQSDATEHESLLVSGNFSSFFFYSKLGTSFQ